MLGICLLSMQLDFMLALLKKDTTTLCLTCKCQEVIACFCILNILTNFTLTIKSNEVTGWSFYTIFLSN